MKNIAIIIASLKTGGGAENVVSQLSFELNKDPYKLHILTFYDAEEERPYSGHRESLRESLKELKLKKLFYRAYKIKQFCKKHNIETAVSFMEEANFPLIFSKLFGNRIKLIISERNNPLTKILVYRIGIRIFYRFANLTVSCTKKIESILRNSFNLKNVHTIYNSFNMSRSTKLQSEDLPSQYNNIFNSKNFVFINVARLVYAKNQQRIIKAFKQVVTKHPHAKLVILGEGKLRSELEEIIKELNLQNDVFLLGNIDNVFPYIKAGQCFVFSSLWEGFPNAVTEALSVNIPIISTDCDSGPREILAPELPLDENIQYPYSGKYGVLVNAGVKETKKQELPTAMLRMLTDSSFREGYRTGGKRLSSFQIPHIVEQWKQVL